jgi:hypothetical protein
MARHHRIAPKVVVSSGKFVRAAILPLRGKDRLNGNEESGWKRPDLLWEKSFTSSSTETVSGELRETNPHLSFVVSLICFDLYHIYFASAQSTWVCLSLSVGIITLLVIIYRSYSRTQVRARSQEKTWVVLQVYWPGRSNRPRTRSNRPMWFSTSGAV